MDQPKLSRNEQEMFRRWRNLDRLVNEKQSHILENHKSLSVRDMRFAREDLTKTVKKRDNLKKLLMKNSKMTWDEVLGAAE